MAPGRTRIAITNSGTHPDAANIAVAAFSLDAEVSYFTSSTWAQNSLIQQLAMLPIWSRTPVARLIRRRALPSGIPNSGVVHVALKDELRFQLAVAMRRRNRGEFLFRCIERFDEKTATKLAKNPPELVISQYLGAQKIFQALPNTHKVLIYPIAHHRWMEKTFEHEAEANPRFAKFIHSFGAMKNQAEREDEEIELSDSIIVPSTFVKETFVSEGVNPAKILVAQLGANIGTAPDKERAYDVAGIGSSRPLNVLFAGQVTQRKGISYLVDAVRAVKNVQLTIVGNPMPGILDALRLDEPPLTERVTIHSAVDRDRLAELMRRADALILPSLAEGFPLVAIEAMACGTPCVMTNNTSASDVIRSGKNGIVIDAHSSESIESALHEFLRHPQQLEHMGVAARHTASTYSWERYRLQIRDYLESLIETVDPR